MRESRINHKIRLEAQEHKIFLIVKKIIDQADPESLLKLGCPQDEYDTASKWIASAIIREGAGSSVTSLAYIVALALHAEFDMWSRPVTLHEQHIQIARKLVPPLPKIKR